MPKVLVVATSRKTRGGITSVINAHEQGQQWSLFHCHWVQTHRDGNPLRKLGYLIGALIDFCCRLPFYDIVHIHISEPVSALRKIPFFVLSKILGKKTIIHFHSFSPETTILGMCRNVYKYLFTHADCVIVLSEFWKEIIIKNLPVYYNAIRVLYNPCPQCLIDKDVESKMQILYAGTLNERKGYKDLIKAFALIAKRYPDWKIVFAGNGEIEEGKNLAKNLGIAVQTEFIGWITGNMKAKVFQESSIFCLPSYAEGFPMAVLDAWAYGLPVITTPVGGIPDVAQDGKNMMLFMPGDTNTLAAKMDMMIRDVSLRNAIREESVKLSQTIFNIKVINERLGDIYTDVANATRV